ncbi:hypothetical protein [Polyangium mundeleinium]|uniref:Transposase n=1 Tax=Polyangium mundeleinium TaxID=2995306 RepID=A0ABT5F6H1_9BACT|nr:hypothetical protein [Polyangium mundeleinium]MDC0749702.1 hypothetical protein [Polyangium mundeleinium]
MRNHQRAAVIRAEIEQSVRGRGNAYPEQVRRRATEYFWLRRGEGATVVEIGPEIGLHWRTLYGWAKGAAPPELPAVGFSPVEIMDIPATRAGGPLVVQHRSGLRVEGLDLDALVELLRRLS